MRPCLLFVLFISLICSSCNDEETYEIIDVFPEGSKDSASITGLPIIVITTDDGVGITNKDTWKTGCLTIEGDYSVHGFSDSILIKGRGNASFHYPKKSFTLKFNRKQSLLGMSKHKRWVFQANYHDRTLLRNALTFHLSHFSDKMEWNPHAEFAEVILNGEHIGNYLVCEQIRVDQNRVPIETNSTNDEDCGFLFEYDYYYDTKPRFRSTISHFPICIKYPDEDECRDSQLMYAREFIESIEVSLHTHNFNKLFDEYIDFGSFVDYWIIMTITGNIEPAKPRSVYCYKKPSGKLFAGPLWDFDFSTYKDLEGTDNQDVLYFTWLFKSQFFRDRVKERWKELYPVLRQEAVDYIMLKSVYLSKSEEINHELWPIVFPYLKKCENGDELLPYQEAIDNLLRITLARMDYIDSFVQKL